METAAFLVAAALAVIVLVWALIAVAAALCQLTWPLRWLLHVIRARVAIIREFDRAYALWTHPASR